MQEFDAWGMAMLLRHISRADTLTQKMCDLGGRDQKLSQEDVRLHVQGNLMHALVYAQKLQLESVYDRVADHGPFTMASKVGLTWQEFHNQLSVLREAIEADLEKRLFVFIPPRDAELTGNIEKNWGGVWSDIPDSKEDIQEAVSCYVLGRPTACVFHSMRIAEHGLRRIARKVKAKPLYKGKPKPIESSDWNDLITAIKTEIAKIRQKPRGPKRDELLERFSDAADHCEYMKDIWRNSVSHARKAYKPAEALAVMERVRDCMTFVTTSLKASP